MISRIYQVFVSSTYQDLVEERRVVLEILPQLGCLPILLPSQGPQAWPSVRKRIEISDYYILLVGSRYGSLTPSGVSHTHQEYIHARHKKKPMLIFMHGAPDTRPESLQETTPEGRSRFQDFRQIFTENICLWQTTAELTRLLRSKIPLFIENNPCDGWVRGEKADEPSPASSSPPPVASGAVLARTIVPRQAAVQDTELEEARLRIAELEAEREQWLSGHVKPLELAQGQEKAELIYQANVYHAGHCELLMLRTEISWNEVFLALAIHLRQPQPEKFMMERLGEFLRQRGLEDAQRLRAKAHALTDIKINDLTFNTVRVQLRALGLITRARFVQRLSASDALWQLSLQGELLMNRLLLRFKTS